MSESDNSVSKITLEPIRVKLAGRGYNIHFNDDWAKILGNYRNLRPFIVCDSNVAGGLLPKWKKYLPEAELFIVPAGEKSKSSTMLWNIYTHLIDRNYGRDTLVIALGGGVIGDLAGYAAATYMRGVQLIQVPTTLLAMVDSSIGGKVGIDHWMAKNVIGAFKQPNAVLIDFENLTTLPVREWHCGFGEMIKYAFIDRRIDPHKLEASYFSCIDGSIQAIFNDIYQCAAIKAEFVEADELDNTNRRIMLNFGHTIGHALETATEYKFYKHGEAVAAGIAGACLISNQLGLLSGDLLKEIIITLAKFPFPPSENEIHLDDIMRAIYHDKKMESGKIRFVLLKSIGEPVVTEVDEENIRSGIEFTLSFLKKR